MTNNSISDGIHSFFAELSDLGSFPVATKGKKYSRRPESSPEYHAVRILLLLRYAGKGGKIGSKNRFAFYDFLLRFPICLKHLLNIFQIPEEFSEAELKSLDQHMIKHLNTAWDPDYYNYFGYLKSRGLIEYSYKQDFEIALTERGKDLIGKLKMHETSRLIRRCKLIKNALGDKSDNRIGEIIQKHFSFTVI